MQQTVQFAEERAELDVVLRSGLLNRSPHLVRFLTYVCEHYFEGRSSQIKEYTIGVEALGRPAGFDPKKDSIVRVEAHRLRKRLETYYSAEGVGHHIKIVIPNGQYVPRFVTSEPEVAPDVPVSAPPAPPVRRPPWKRWLLVGIAPFLGAIVIAAILRSPRPSQANRPVAADDKWNGPPDPVPAEFRMLAGYHGRPLADVQGHTWMPDAYYTGGHSQSIPHGRSIACAPDPDLLRTERSGRFSYAIPLGRGTYELHLLFAETEYGPGNPLGGGESSRVMQVSVNGTPVLRSLDPLAEAGAPNLVDERVLKDISPASDGKLHLKFEGGPSAFLNAVEILPTSPGSIRPVRIVTQQNPVTDSDGRIWSADEYFIGGRTVLRGTTILDEHDKCLYRGERYGHFTYRIPLAPGKYRLTLHFAETWFGTPESHEPALGSRLFDVFANGVALIQNFEIAREAGRNRALTKVFHNLEPNAQGTLSIEFNPVENYAEVNAIEVVETE